MHADGMFWQLARISGDKVLPDTVKARNSRFAPMVKNKRPIRGAFGPGMSEQGHNCSSKLRLKNLRVQNCARSFNHNVGETRLIKAR